MLFHKVHILLGLMKEFLEFLKCVKGRKKY